MNLGLVFKDLEMLASLMVFNDILLQVCSLSLNMSMSMSKIF